MEPAPLPEGLTDEQRSHFALLVNRIEYITQQYDNMTAQRDDAVAALHAAGRAADAERNEWREEFDRHLKRANEAVHDRTRAENRFTLLAAVAQDALADFLETYSPFELSALTPEWRHRVKAAREMLKLIERECT